MKNNYQVTINIAIEHNILRVDAVVYTNSIMWAGEEG